MKKVLIAAVILLSLGLLLDLSLDLVVTSGTPGFEIAQWRDYNVPSPIDVAICPDIIYLDNVVPNGPRPTPTRIQQKGRWLNHAFYCDSPQDSSTQVLVARQLPNEDLEVDIDYFIPNYPGRLYCVKVMRGNLDEYHPYPTTQDPAYRDKHLVYPPPKGLIRVGMLEADLITLPWHSDGIYYTEHPGSIDPDGSAVYHYHTDAHSIRQLLVTVSHGRVTDVSGGNEETFDPPLPAPPPPPDFPPAPASIPKPEAFSNEKSWALWLFDLLFTKPTHSD